MVGFTLNNGEQRTITIEPGMVEIALNNGEQRTITIEPGMVEITLNNGEQRTITIEPGEVYKINNVLKLQNRWVTPLKLFYAEPSDTNSGFFIGAKDIINNGDNLTIYITADTQTFVEVSSV